MGKTGNIYERSKTNPTNKSLFIVSSCRGRTIGVMACSALGIYDHINIATPDEETSLAVIPRRTENLAQEAFFFTHLEDEIKLKERFGKWLENVIVVGLEFWRKNL